MRRFGVLLICSLLAASAHGATIKNIASFSDAESRAVPEFDVSAAIQADRILAASLILTSAMTQVHSSGPIAQLLCAPESCDADLSDGFAGDVLGVFPFANRPLSVDVAGYVRQEAERSATTLRFLPGGGDEAEGGWAPVRELVRSLDVLGPAVRPKLALMVSAPEPASVILMSTALLLVARWARRRGL